VDVELTGLDVEVDEVIAYGAVPIEHGRIRAAGAIRGVVRPLATRPGPVEIHGILPDDLADAEPPEQALVPLARAIVGRTPIAHAAWVEQAFLGPALRRAGGKLPRRIVDTAMLWRLLAVVRDGRDPGYRPLREITDALGLPSHHPHEALGDALTTAQVFLALATHLEALDHGRIGDLVSAGRRVEAHRMLHGPRA
jgi:DNA polymerase-3 subunit epsilon